MLRSPSILVCVEKEAPAPVCVEKSKHSGLRVEKEAPAGVGKSLSVVDVSKDFVALKL